MNFIIFIASVITSLTIIISCIITLYKLIHTFENKRAAQERHEKENYLNILRLIIMNDNMPLEERIAAGDRDLKGGGNGVGKHFYNELINKL